MHPNIYSITLPKLKLKFQSLFKIKEYAFIKWLNPRISVWIRDKSGAPNFSGSMPYGPSDPLSENSLAFRRGFLDILPLFFLVSRPGWGKWYVLDLVTSLGKKHSAMVGKMLMNIGPSSAGKSFDRLHAWRTESLTWRFAKSTRIRLYRWTSYRSESCTERLWHPWAVPHV